MAKFTRSPSFESVSASGLSYGILRIYIWTGNKNTPPPVTYTLRKSATTPATGNPRVSFEISELIRDYLDTEFDGNYTGQGVWVGIALDGYNSSDVSFIDYAYTTIAFDGYDYFEDPLPISSNLMITNRKLFVLEDNAFRVPIDTSLNDPTVTFLKDNEIVGTTSFQSSNESSEQIRYVSIYGDTTNWDTFKERVLQDGGKDYESNKCLEAYFNDYSIGAVDKIIISNTNANVKNITVDVEILEECKYEPKKVTFVNKFGALQDMYFFKKSVQSMNVEKESYKSNILNSSNNGYSTSNRVYRNFNVVGRESITLSSGFLGEEYNEVFKQMMLSEKVWITNITDDGEQVLPINVKTGDITYKTSLNDKLVQYTIEFDKSFDTINNIR
jgi:hypothetical protein